MRTHTFSLELHRSIVLSTNDKKAHGRAGIEPKKALRQHGSIQARTTPRMGRAEINVVVSYPDRIGRDAQNYQATMKPIIDGMAHPDLNDRHNPNKGFLVDDNDLFLDGPFIRWSGRMSGKPDFYRFDVIITEMEPWTL